MKRNIIVFILLAISVFLICIVARAENYIITILGGGEVIVIEHDGEITAFGCGDRDRSESEYTDKSDYPLYAIVSGVLHEEDSRQYWLDRAQMYEEKADWFMAALSYQSAGEIEEMEEAAQKDIEKELAQDPPNYRGAYSTASVVLEDEDLAEYYKGLYEEQEAND